MNPRPVLDALHQQMQALFVIELRALIASPGYANTEQYKKQDIELDALLNSCTGGECCDQCADLFCPYGEGLHFHHDGCPCCSGDAVPIDREVRREQRMARWKTLLARNTRSDP